MSELADPGPENGFYSDHVRLLRDSLRRWTGSTLIDPTVADADCGHWLFEAPFAVLSQGTGADPTFTYGNRAALRIFEISWRDLLSLPSRLSAEPADQSERVRLLERVSKQGCIEDYSGLRISRTGRRFLIERATVWNLLDSGGDYAGQAAMFRDWRPAG